MKLEEILNKKIDYEVSYASHDVFQTKATIGGRLITFEATTEDHEMWDVTFNEKVEGKSGGTYSLTGSGKEFEVFSMVIDSLAEFIERYKPPKVVFSAEHDNESTTRADVYEKLLKRAKFPGYTMKRIPRINHDDFVLKRDDS